MQISLIIAAIIGAAVTLLTLFRGRNATKGQVELELKKSRIREYQELIGQAKSNSITKSQSAKSLKEQYEAMYGNLSRPAATPPDESKRDDVR